MKELLLTDEEARYLIKLLKDVAKQHSHQLTNKSSGEIHIVGKEKQRFILNYFYSANNKVFHLRETEHNYTLLRVNLNNKFHKNANGDKIKGNRINIFSSEEYYLKSDEYTHYKAYPLPYETISNTDDFFQMLTNLLEYTNTQQNGKISINIQEDLL